MNASDRVLHPERACKPSGAADCRLRSLLGCCNVHAMCMQRGSPSNLTATVRSEHSGCYASIAGTELCL